MVRPYPAMSESAMTDPKTEHVRFAVCIRNDDYAVSLERRKIYEIISDPDVQSYHQIRVIDESGEDYLYPEEYFVVMELPKEVERAVIEAL